MDYLKERLPLISDHDEEDIKKFKAKMIDTMYLHHDNFTTIDRIQKLQMEMDQCVLNHHTAKFDETPLLLGYAVMASLYTSILWILSIFIPIFIPFIDLKVFIALHSIGFVIFIVARRSAKRSEKKLHETFACKMQDMKDTCDVLIYLHKA